jgi:hypothetical protein
MGFGPSVTAAGAPITAGSRFSAATVSCLLLASAVTRQDRTCSHPSSVPVRACP